MYTTTVFAKVLLILSFFYTLGLAEPAKGFTVLTKRQSTDLTDPQCLDYSTIANLSTIGANSTYRSAFLQLSPLGSNPNAKLLNAAIAKMPALMMDANLNAKCGNLSTVAFVEAMNNFTQGVIGPFSGMVEKIGANPQAIKAGPEVLVIVGGIMLFFSLVWGLSL
ncbi:hypothetical protein BDV96DRAFT_595958 [Lophiotrema nucula]|uniref:Uncharacterized protein n=1 Tax=Lophiotrema nucula TaxID=690887 RepID=A0A6A5ZL84_9PLEO|nr:hypothetical protein BDV96DRAFT_595958 [Lophiotrema nucula]